MEGLQDGREIHSWERLGQLNVVDIELSATKKRNKETP
jgi:hypothetical protein